MDTERWLDERLDMLRTRLQMGEIEIDALPEKIKRSMFAFDPEETNKRGDTLVTALIRVANEDPVRQVSVLLSIVVLIIMISPDSSHERSCPRRCRREQARRPSASYAVNVGDYREQRFRHPTAAECGEQSDSVRNCITNAGGDQAWRAGPTRQHSAHVRRDES